MKRTFSRFAASFAVALPLLFSACASRPETPTQQAQVAAARQVFRSFSADVDRGDYPDAAALFSADGKFRAGSSWHVAKGPSAVEALLTRIEPYYQFRGIAPQGNPAGFKGSDVMLRGPWYRTRFPQPGSPLYTVLIGRDPDGVWRIHSVDLVAQPDDRNNGDIAQDPQPSIGTDRQYP